MTLNDIPTPFYVVYENRLRRNLELISEVSRRSGAHIIMAFKANAVAQFHNSEEYCTAFTAQFAPTS